MEFQVLWNEIPHKENDKIRVKLKGVRKETTKERRRYGRESQSLE